VLTDGIVLRSWYLPSCDFGCLHAGLSLWKICNSLYAAFMPCCRTHWLQLRWCWRNTRHLNDQLQHRKKDFKLLNDWLR